MVRYPKLGVGVIALAVLATFSAVRAAAPARAVAVCPSGGCANLSISISGPDAGTVGSAIEYDIVVQNNGPTATADAVVADTLPAGAALISADTTQGSCDNAPGGVLTCDLGELDYPGTATIAVTALPLVAGSNYDTAWVFDAAADPSAALDSATLISSMSEVPKAAFSKTGPTTATSPGPIVYTMLLKVPAEFEFSIIASPSDVTISDTLPAGETFVSVSTSPAASCTTPPAGAPGTIVCDFGIISPGETEQNVTETLTTTVNTTAPSITNTATEADSFFEPSMTRPSAAVPNLPPFSVQSASWTTQLSAKTITISGQALLGLTIVTSGCGTTTPSGTVVTNFAQNVVVTAQPCVGSRFTGWTGGPCNGTTINPCDIGVGTSMTVKANFTP